MNLQLMMRDARPTGGVWTLADVAARIQKGERPTKPLLVKAPSDDAAWFALLGAKLPYGSVVVFSGTAGGEVVSVNDWREWNPAGREPHETVFVRSHWDGNTYGSHQKYLLEAVRLTTGPVLELGCGEGSTPALNAVARSGRQVTSVDSDEAWLNKYVDLTYFSSPPSGSHIFFHNPDPAKMVGDGPYGVVFVDHAPGETRRQAILAARNVADYIVIHDTEDCGYQIWDVLESFKYKTHFRYMRPWTSVVSMTRPIFESPYPKER